MGKVSGYVFIHEDQSVYIAGDTIWCDEVKAAIDTCHPSKIVVNGGGARFITGDAIVMDIKDVLAVCDYTPDASVYVVHLEAVNHSQESRYDIKKAIEMHSLQRRCFVPADGEYLFEY